MIDGLCVRCAVCGDEITRDGLVMLGDEWLHVGDEMTLKPVVRRSKYDHLAEPDLIESQGIEIS